MAELFKDNPPGVTETMQACTVGLAGAGGIGSNVASALVRAGLGKLVVADYDRIEPSNLNRQYYFTDQIGFPKVVALRRNLELINPEVQVETHERMIDTRNAASIFSGADILVEALDLDEAKVMILETWLSGFPGVPVVSCSGVAGYGRTDRIRVDRREGLIIVGDQESELSQGTLSARVGIVASIMANEIIAIIRGRASL